MINLSSGLIRVYNRVKQTCHKSVCGICNQQIFKGENQIIISFSLARIRGKRPVHSECFAGEVQKMLKSYIMLTKKAKTAIILRKI